MVHWFLMGVVCMCCVATNLDSVPTFCTNGTLRGFAWAGQMDETVKTMPIYKPKDAWDTFLTK